MNSPFGTKKVQTPTSEGFDVQNGSPVGLLNSIEKSPIQAEINLKHIDPSVREYVYQTLAELEPYATQETMTVVIAKDPRELSQIENSEFADMTDGELALLQRVSISMTTDGSTLESEGVADDVIDALFIAKESMISALIEIQDAVVSSSDRQLEIANALSGESQLH